MESYRTEEEQVEALKRWWDENGRSTIAGIVLALVAAFGWQGWQDHRQGQRESASDLYQQLLNAASGADQSPALQGQVERLAVQLKVDFESTTYAQFAALQLARLAVLDGDLDTAESELRWVLARADTGSDTALVTRQRLARVMASRGEIDAALALLEVKGNNPYQASYALARGDILLAAGRDDEAAAAFQLARGLAASFPGQVNLSSLEQKLDRLNPVAPAEVELPGEDDRGDGTGDDLGSDMGGDMGDDTAEVEQ